MEARRNQVTDRISELPDAVLHQILDLLPLKSAIRTSILSRRWKSLWKYSLICATSLDFGEEFANSQRPEEFVRTVNRYLQLHNGRKIERFRLRFDLSIEYYPEAEKWIQFATSKGAKELHLDFSYGADYRYYLEEDYYELPAFLFCDSLIQLNLRFCNFRAPLGSTGFASLKSLQLKEVYITDKTLEAVISNCPLLETLDLRDCLMLNSIKVLGSNLLLKNLIVVAAYEAYEIEILAPNLQSFHFHGFLFYGLNVSMLVDAFIRSFDPEFEEPEQDYFHNLSGLSHVKILTICTGPLLYLTKYEEYHSEDLPITFPNLEELQILIDYLDNECLDYMYHFFKHTIFPCLEKLFIALSTTDEDNESVEEPSWCNFLSLHTIKISNFRGRKSEMSMVKFFLNKAVNLEELILVIAQDYMSKENMRVLEKGFTDMSRPYSTETQINNLRDELLIMSKASQDAKIVLCHNWEDDNSICPTHTEYYDTF